MAFQHAPHWRALHWLLILWSFPGSQEVTGHLKPSVATLPVRMCRVQVYRLLAWTGTHHMLDHKLQRKQAGLCRRKALQQVHVCSRCHLHAA